MGRSYHAARPTRRGERLNGFTHLAGALASVAGLVWLVVVAAARHDPFRVVACAVFARR